MALHGQNDVYEVLARGRINPISGFGIGVDDSRQLRNWLSLADDALRMSYPGGVGWGAVFLTVGGNAVPPPRPSQDFSTFSGLSIEMRADQDGACVLVGLKDYNDPDDGSEPKVAKQLTQAWRTYNFPLQSSFSTPRHPAASSLDLSRLYVVTEFVFPCGSNVETTVYVRSIRFEP